MSYLYTVPNDSYRFWAVLHLEGHDYGVADIHKYWIQNAIATLYVTQIFLG